MEKHTNRTSPDISPASVADICDSIFDEIYQGHAVLSRTERHLVITARKALVSAALHLDKAHCRLAAVFDDMMAVSNLMLSLLKAETKRIDEFITHNWNAMHLAQSSHAACRWKMVREPCDERAWQDRARIPQGPVVPNTADRSAKEEAAVGNGGGARGNKEPLCSDLGAMRAKMDLALARAAARVSHAQDTVDTAKVLADCVVAALLYPNHPVIACICMQQRAQSPLVAATAADPPSHVVLPLLQRTKTCTSLRLQFKVTIKTLRNLADANRKQVQEMERSWEILLRNFFCHCGSPCPATKIHPLPHRHSQGHESAVPCQAHPAVDDQEIATVQ
jgi:hypothetical protein